ncbi:hypothetical protein GCM10023147_05110 [Tsukamurella soli]|uniref:DUF6779 domain-containing protein n=1 Tax=Tsukamurella soli TaxID=644556 RepID=A0ABP8J3U7_9ACTN
MGQLMLAAIIVLAVIGTVLSVFVDSEPWGAISLILLIWGLVIAAFLIARYLRDLRAADAKERDLKLVYDLQLEREITARREYELTLERDLRADLRAEANAELDSLKSEVLALRANLEELLGRDLGPSYAELYATAQRRALAEAAASSGVFEDDDRVRAQQDFESMHRAHVASGENLAAGGDDFDSYYGSDGGAGGDVTEFADDFHDDDAADEPIDAEHALIGHDGGPGDESPTTVFQAVVDEPVQRAQAPSRDETRIMETVVETESVEQEEAGGRPSSGRRFGFGFGRSRQAAPEPEPVDIEPVEDFVPPPAQRGFAAERGYQGRQAQQGYPPQRSQGQQGQPAQQPWQGQPGYSAGPGYPAQPGWDQPPAEQVWQQAPTQGRWAHPDQRYPAAAAYPTGPAQQYAPDESVAEQVPAEEPARQDGGHEGWENALEWGRAGGRSSGAEQDRTEPDQAAEPAAEGHDPVNGQHSSGSTVAELIARMNAGTERTAGRRRHGDDV